MRGLSGIDVLREVKQIDKYTEVIVLTAYETLETARQAITLGASEYLKKPFDLDHIQRIVDRCYGNYLFNTQQDEVIRQDVNAAKSNFLEIVSHELNTPMNGILGFIELLEDTALDEEQRDYVETIRDCSKQYFENVQDIFTYAKLSMSDIEMSNTGFNPATMMIKLGSEVSPVHAQVQFRLEIPEDLPPFVSGPERELKILLKKLLENAVKFTSRGEVCLKVEFRMLDRERCQLDYTVLDTGPGIDPEYLKSGRLFDAFSQGDSSLKRSHGGLGIGLALCRVLSDRLQSDLRIESELGRGELPLFGTGEAGEYLGWLESCFIGLSLSICQIGIRRPTCAPILTRPTI